MKKTMLSAALLATALVFPFVSCNNSYVESTPETTPEEKEDKTPEEKEEEPPEEEEVKPVPSIGPDFVYVEGTTVEGGDKFAVDGNTGVFITGRTVTIDDFFMCNHEVTQEEFEAVMGINPSQHSSNPAEGEKQEKRPVDTVSWYDIIAYCNKRSISDNLKPCYKINKITDWENLDYNSIPTSYNEDWSAVICDFTANGYRLPTEVEWEYAALGGKAGVEAKNPSKWSGTNDISELGLYAWTGNNSGFITHQAMTKKANSLDIFDMSGNLLEWIWDSGDPITKETSIYGNSTGETKTMRGGCFNNSDTAEFLNHTSRVTYYTPDFKNYDVGFRVARSK